MVERFLVIDNPGFTFLPKVRGQAHFLAVNALSDLLALIASLGGALESFMFDSLVNASIDIVAESSIRDRSLFVH
jgi:hypothetical protein